MEIKPVVHQKGAFWWTTEKNGWEQFELLTRCEKGSGPEPDEIYSKMHNHKKNLKFILTAVRNRLRRPGDFCSDRTSVDEWRRCRRRPPNVAGGLRGGTAHCRSHGQQQQQQQQQQQPHVLAGNIFLYKKISYVQFSDVLNF